MKGLPAAFAIAIFLLAAGLLAANGVKAHDACSDLTLAATNDGPACFGGGESVTLSALTNAQSPTFTWTSRHGGLTLYGQTVVTNWIDEWFVTMSDAGTGCSKTAQTTVEYEPAAKVNAPQSATGDFTASIAGDPNGPYTDAQWSVSEGTIITGQGTATITVHPHPPSGTLPGTNFAVVVSAAFTRSSSNCRVQGESYTQVQAPPMAISTAATACPNSTSLTASVSDVGPGAFYVWSISNASIVSAQGAPSITFNATGAGPIHILVNAQWNSWYGSAETNIPVTGPTAVVAGGGEICPGVAATVSAFLNGTPPFTLHWSDGVVQAGVSTLAVTRTVSPAESTTYLLTSVSDASCTGSASGAATITLISAPEIVLQPKSVSVVPGGSARLTVGATDDAESFDWYEGPVGNMSKLAGRGMTLETPPLTRSTSYWVRVSNRCGQVMSQAAMVTVAGKRRAVGH